MQTIITAGVDEEEYAGLVRLLNIPRERRTSEDVFEIANSLYRASFVRQLDVVTRCAECIVYVKSQQRPADRVRVRCYPGK